MELTLDHLPVIDWELGIKLAGGKKELAEDLLKLLTKHIQNELNDINYFSAEQNYPELLKRVHKLHGGISYCGTPRLKSLISHIETQMKNNIMSDLPILLSQLNTEVNLLLEHSSPQ